MARMRTLPIALEEIKQKDPETRITLSALRKWAKSGQIPIVKAGRTALVNMDALERCLEGVAYGG